MTPAYVLSRSYVGMHNAHGDEACRRSADALLDHIRTTIVPGWEPVHTRGTQVPPTGAVLVGGVANTKDDESDLAIWVYPVTAEAMVLRDRCDQYPPHPRYVLENRYQDTGWDILDKERFEWENDAVSRAALLSTDAIRFGMVRVYDTRTNRVVLTFAAGGGIVS